MPQRFTVARLLIFARMICAADGIQRRRGLIEQQQLRPIEQRFGKSRPSLLARGQQSALGMRANAQDRTPAAVPRRGCAATRRRTAARKSANSRITVKLPGSAAYTAAKLVRASARARCFEISIPSISTLAGGRREHAQYHVDGRRLAGAVGSQQPDDFSAIHGKGHVVEGSHSAVHLAKVSGANRGAVRHGRAWRESACVGLCSAAAK